MPVEPLASPSAASVRPGRWLLWLAALVSVVAALSPRDLWAPDEPRYGLVARTMADTGELLVPRLNGLVYAEKPPFLFWTMAGAAKVAGSLPAPLARLPAALLAAVAVLSVARLARAARPRPCAGGLGPARQGDGGAGRGDGTPLPDL